MMELTDGDKSALRKPVSLSDLEVAATWLEANEGEDGEQFSCLRVASWIRKEQARRINEAAIRSAAKAAGVPLRIAKSVAKRQGGK
ncbi:hypothetical protein [Microcystis phage Mae-JY30]